jgi:hypothetical protein
MASDKQIEANRRNSEKCTGPRTPAGRANSSQNALKSGIDAESLIIRTEDPAQYRALADAYFAQFTPATEHERTLVDALISSEWLRRRYLRVESCTWNSRLDGNTSLSAAYTWVDEKLARVDRRINSAQRNFQQALKQLMDIQAKRALEPTPEPAEATEIDVAAEGLRPALVSFLGSAPEALLPPLSDPCTPAPVTCITSSPSAEPTKKDPWPVPIAA